MDLLGEADRFLVEAKSPAKLGGYEVTNDRPTLLDDVVCPAAVGTEPDEVVGGGEDGLKHLTFADQELVIL